MDISYLFQRICLLRSVGAFSAVLLLTAFNSHAQSIFNEPAAIWRAANLEEFDSLRYKSELISHGIPEGTANELVRQERLLLEQGRKVITNGYTRLPSANTTNNLCGTCHDMGAENGWGVWEASKGTNDQLNSLTLNPTVLPDPPRFSITTGAGIDRLTPGVRPGDPPITVVAPPGFGNSSIRLGQLETDGQGGGCSNAGQLNLPAGCAERLTYCFTVGIMDTNFVYAYAFVMENPSDTNTNNFHTTSQMPFVEFLMLDANGDTVSCAYKRYLANDNFAGQYICNDNRQQRDTAIYKPWTVEGVNLSAYIGQTLTVVITNADCQLGGHFCHSYWDFACGSSASVVTPNCYPNAPDTLTAPDPPDPSATYTYLWYRNNTPSPIGTTQTITAYSQPGDTFTVRITTSSGCFWYARYVPLHFQTSTDFNFTTSCGYASFTDSSYSPSAVAPISFWLWNFGNNVTPPRSTDQNPSPVYFPPGNHTVTLVSGIAYSQGCRDTVTYTVNVPQVPIAAFNRSGNCQGAPVQFTSTSSIGAPDSIVSYAWTFQGGTPSTSNVPNPTVTFANSGQTQITLIVTGSNGCSDTLTRNFTVQATPVAAFTVSSVCLGDTVRLQNSSTIGVSGVQMYYDWTIPGGNPSSSSSRNPLVTFTAPGAYNIELVTSVPAGCSDTAIRTVIVSAPPVAAFTAPPACLGGPVQFTNTSVLSPGDSIVSIHWDFPGGSPSSGNGLNPIVSFPTSGTYPVTMYLTNAGGCSDTIQQNVTIYTNPTASFSVQDICLGAPLVLTNTSTANPPGSPMSYTWSTTLGSFSNDTSANPALTIQSPGTATVTLITNTVGGCADTATQTLNVLPMPSAGFSSSTECLGDLTLFTNSSTVQPGDAIASYAWSFPGAVPSVSSAMNPAVSFAGAGTATVTLVVTNTSGCSDSVSQIVTVLPVPVAAFSGVDVCLGASVAVNNATTILPAGTSVSYSWDAPGASPAVSTSQQPVFNYPVAGTYSVTLVAIAAGGCADTVQQNIIVHPLPLAAFSVPDVCAGSTSDFANSTTVSAGDAIGTYQWQFQNGTPAVSSAASPSVQFPAPGSYAVGLTATTVNGCVDTFTAVALVLPQPVASFIVSPVCLGNTVQPSNTSSILPVGTPVTYDWTFPGGTSASASPTLNFTTAGSYPVTLIAAAAGGCTDTVQQTVVIHPLPTAAFSAPDFCEGVSGNLSDLSAVSGAGTITNYSWTIPGATPASSSQQNVSVVFAAADTAMVGLLVTTADGCSDSVVNPVIIHPVPVLNVPDIQVCPGASGALVASGAASYLWNTGATTAAISVTPASTTVYTVTGTTLGCSATVTAIAAVSNSMTVNTGPGDTVCLGSSVMLQALPASGNFTYVWTPGTGLSSTSVSNPVSTPVADITYTVTVTDANGCSGTSAVRVMVDPYPVATANATPVNCFGGSDGSVFATPSGGFGPYQFSWSNGCTSVSCTGLAAGSYSVIVSDAIGCTVTASATVTEPSLLTVSGTPTATVPCFGSCTAAADAVPAGGTPPYQFLWSSVPAQSASTANGLCAGAYQCTVSDANGCTAVQSVSVSEPTPVVPQIISDVPCAGGSTYLTASATGGSGSYTYSWSPSTGLSSVSISDPVASPAALTTYTVVVTDANGCVSPPDTVNVNPSIALTVNAAGTGPVCPGDTVYLSATGANGNGGPYSFQWSDQNGITISANANVIVTPFFSTSYFVTVSDGCSSPQTDSVDILVHIPPDPIVSSTPAEGCAPLCVTFSSGLAPGAATLLWDFGSMLGDSTAMEPTICFETPGTYEVDVIATSPEGCTAATDAPTNVVVHEGPTADFTIDNSTGNINTPVFQFQDASSSNVVQWMWNFGDGTPLLNGGPVATHSYADAAASNEFHSFVATLLVTTRFGCVDTVSRPIRLEPVFEFFIPNAFTPNGDDANSTFYGKGIGIKEYEMWIFDRWGLEIFHCEQNGSNVPWDYHGQEGMSSNCRWDGRVEGRPVQQDVYVWKVRLTDVFGVRHDYIGRVTALY
ncbi:MAG: hypothetical protein RL213_221 [Bacteroidota bacterium]